MTVSSEPEITAMQITTEEDFMIISSSGIFEKLQGIDLMNIIWQQALMEAQKSKHTDILINSGNLVDTLIKLASFKREAPVPEGAPKGTSAEESKPGLQLQRPSFTIILILFKSFKEKLKKYLDQSK